MAPPGHEIILARDSIKESHKGKERKTFNQCYCMSFRKASHFSCRLSAFALRWQQVGTPSWSHSVTCGLLDFCVLLIYETNLENPQGKVQTSPARLLCVKCGETVFFLSQAKVGHISFVDIDINFEMTSDHKNELNHNTAGFTQLENVELTFRCFLNHKRYFSSLSIPSL